MCVCVCVCVGGACYCTYIHIISPCVILTKTFLELVSLDKTSFNTDMVEMLSDLNTASPLLYTTSSSVSMNVDLKCRVLVLSEVDWSGTLAGWSGILGRIILIHECTSPRLKGPVNLSTLQGLEGQIWYATSINFQQIHRLPVMIVHSLYTAHHYTNWQGEPTHHSSPLH